MEKYNENLKNFLGPCPKLHHSSIMDLLGDSQHPLNSQLIIATAGRSFSQNGKKNRPANFSLFPPLILGEDPPCFCVSKVMYNAILYVLTDSFDSPSLKNKQLD